MSTIDDTSVNKWGKYALYVVIAIIALIVLKKLYNWSTNTQQGFDAVDADLEQSFIYDDLDGTDDLDFVDDGYQTLLFGNNIVPQPTFVDIPVPYYYPQYNWYYNYPRWNNYPRYGSYRTYNRPNRQRSVAQRRTNSNRGNRVSNRTATRANQSNPSSTRGYLQK